MEGGRRGRRKPKSGRSYGKRREKGHLVIKCECDGNSREKHAVDAVKGNERMKLPRSHTL